MATLRELIVKFSLDADTKAVKRFDEMLGELLNSVSSLVSWGAKLVGTYAAVGGALAANSAKAADFAEEVMRSATAFGITTAKYQEQLFAMQALGASADDLADAYSTLAERAVQAEEGSKEYRKEFERLGIEIDGLSDKNPGEIFDIYVQRASEMTDATQRAAASAALLGDDLGRRVARGLNVAGSNFGAYIQIIRKVGGVFNEQLLEGAQKAQISFRLLGATFATLRKRIGLELAPAFGAFADSMVRFFSDNAGAIEAFIFRLRDGVARELERIKFVAQRTDDVVQRVFGGWENLAAGVAAAIGGIVTVMSGAKIATVVQPLIAVLGAITAPIAVLIGQILGVAAIIGVLALAFEDLWIEINGGRSTIGKLIENFREMGGILGDAIATVLELTVENFRALANEFSALTDEFGPDLIKLFKWLAGIIISWAGAALLLFINYTVLLARVVVGAIRALNWLGEMIFSVFTDALARAMADTIVLVRLLWNTFKDFARDSILEPVLDQIERLKALLLSLPGLEGMSVGEQMIDSELAQPDAFGAASNIAGGARGVVSNQTSTRQQKNEFNVNVEANSAAEGREAARGFKEEIQGGGFMSSIRSFFEPGEV